MQRAAARLRGVDSTIDAGDRGFRPIPKDQPEPGASLRDVFVFFAAKPSPRIIATTFLVAAASRLVIGDWGWWDVATPAAIIALEPITARKHREHHRNPKDLRIVMVPFEALFPALFLALLAALLLEPARAAMLVASAFGMLLYVEEDSGGAASGRRRWGVASVRW